VRSGEGAKWRKGLSQVLDSARKKERKMKSLFWNRGRSEDEEEGRKEERELDTCMMII